MSGWDISPGTAEAQLHATMAYADTGPGNSRIQLFTTAQPTPGAPIIEAPQVEIVLADPCGTIAAGVWSLVALTPGGSLVMQNGIPRWGRWLSAAGEWVADGDVSDAAGTGAIRIAGGLTPAGETGPMLYAGGLAILGSTAFT